MALEPAVTHRIGHVSDTHFTASGVLHESTDPARNFTQVLETLEATGLPLSAVVHTGDIADEGEPQAYRSAMDTARVVLDRTGWPFYWLAGNHDDRASIRQHLLGLTASGDALDSVHDLDGLRLIVLDTSIPGRVEGAIDDDRLAWLRDTLQDPAEHGTVIALHHPPVPVEVTALQPLHLTGQSGLAAVLAGSDVRAILGGHLHYTTTSLFAGIPVFVAPASAYTIRLTTPGGGVVGADAGQAAGVLTLYDDGRAGYTLLPVLRGVPTTVTPESALAGLGVPR